MRLTPFAPDPMHNPVAGRLTLDGVLELNARRNPEGRALAGEGLPFAGSWRDVDEAASALAAIFASWRLGEDAVVGVQLGSSWQGALVCLGLWRAGLVPAMLPLGWRRFETARALLSVGASAMVTMTHAAGAPLAEIACEVAWGLEGVRFIGCFGDAAPDGVTPLDAALSDPDVIWEGRERPEDAADHVAVITFEAGGVPVPRSHNELVAAALTPLLAARLSEEAALVSTLDLAGLPGLGTGLAPWLTTGATVLFHQASDGPALAAVVHEVEATHLTLPGRAADRLIAECGLDAGRLQAVTAVWRAPDGRGPAKPLGVEGATVVDAVAIGELGLLAGARTNEALHAPLPLGASGPDGLAPLIDLRVLPDGRLFIRGPACPQAAFPGDPGAPTPPFGADGYLDTGLTGIADRVVGRVLPGGRRRGVAQIGGLAVSLGDAEMAARVASLPAKLATQEDALFGTRFVLGAGEDGAAADAIVAAGFSPALLPASAVRGRARGAA